MKRCPACKRTYHDETFSFCLVDGSVLSAPFDTEETKIFHAERKKNLQATEVMPFVQRQTQNAVEFIGSDRNYLKWLSLNPKGFVLNTRKEMNPQYMVLHKAICSSINSEAGVTPGGFTERAYIKVCSKTVDGLESWVRKHGRPDGSFSLKCNVCKPDKGIAHTPEEYTLENVPGTIKFLKAHLADARQVWVDIKKAGRMSTTQLGTRLRRKLALRLALIELLTCDNLAWGYGKLRHYQINPNPPKESLEILKKG